jgi:hypothetical protein
MYIRIGFIQRRSDGLRAKGPFHGIRTPGKTNARWLLKSQGKRTVAIAAGFNSSSHSLPSRDQGTGIYHPFESLISPPGLYRRGAESQHSFIHLLRLKRQS